uniref:NADH-ubiquinone oxidoreductase chain 6 n=1 Tax=Sclerophasma paresisense TaxID=253126 RepID=Q2Q1I5_9NEOP|nr:NADH dehydrogenase subunit 6 [Sclerophasma paresisense]ABB81901.1 NADH dehydrogenase subunit 6 [Sclerophasma paresisense]
MTTVLIMLMTANLIMFLQMNNPLSLGMLLLVQTTLLSLFTSAIMKSSWFSYVLFMVFIGGLLILFIYVISLASNEMFYSFSKMNILMTMIMMLMLTTMLLYKNDMFIIFNNYDMMSMENSYKAENIDLVIKIFNQKSAMITLTMMIYLLLTLFVIVSIMDIFKGPIRQKN